MLSEIGGFGSVIILAAQCINYFLFRFSMLSDSKELFSLVVKNNNLINENIIKKKNINKLIEENINNKKESDKNLRIFDTEQKIKK